jgi:hypothetical protein
MKKARSNQSFFDRAIDGHAPTDHLVADADRGLAATDIEEERGYEMEARGARVLAFRDVGVREIEREEDQLLVQVALPELGEQLAEDVLGLFEVAEARAILPSSQRRRSCNQEPGNCLYKGRARFTTASASSGRAR